MNENGLYFDRFALLIFWGIFFCRHPKNYTNRKLQPQILGVTLCLLKLSELLHDSFFFPRNEKLSAYLKRKQSYDVLTWSSLRRLCHLCWHSLQTNRFFSKVGPLHEWWLLSAQCTKPKLQLSVLKVVGTHNLDTQRIQQSSGNFNILCGNDESHPLTKMPFFKFLSELFDINWLDLLSFNAWRIRWDLFYGKSLEPCFDFYCGTDHYWSLPAVPSLITHS